MKLLIALFISIISTASYTKEIKIPNTDRSMGWSVNRIVDIEEAEDRTHLIGHNGRKQLTVIKERNQYYAWSYTNDYSDGERLRRRKISSKHLKNIFSLTKKAFKEDCQFNLNISIYGEIVGYMTELDCQYREK